MIGVDWGTSNFRAFLLDNAGGVRERRAFPSGILRVTDGRFGEVLLAHVGDWIAAGERQLLLCGMVGSRGGWVEAKYVDCPAGLEELASHAVRVPFDAAEAFLVPGVRGQDAQGVPEVMRGEETEVMGIIEQRPAGALICLPGTHSKWVHLEHNAIVRFSTCMTGDVFAALRSATILAQDAGADHPHDQAAFERGIARSAEPGGLLHHLFSVRTLVLSGSIERSSAASYLSGLLIGHEVRTMTAPGDHVHLVGAHTLCQLYAQAIKDCAGSVTMENEDAAARGLAAIGRSLRWT